MKRRLSSQKIPQAAQEPAAAHPIQDLIFELLEEGGPERYSISEASVQRVMAAILELQEDAALPQAVASIVAYAGFLQADCKSPKAAARLMAVAVMATPLVEAAVELHKHHRSDKAKGAGKRFQRFSGAQDHSRSAPKLEGAPKSGLTLGALRPRSVFR